MIQLQNITKTFDKRTILHDFNLNIEEREFVSIMGPSGAGKTTALHIIGMLTKPDAGTLTVNGITNPTTKQVRDLRRYTFGYIFQNYVLMDNETVATNLKISKKYNPNYNDQLVEETLETVGLNETFLKKKIYQLSGGEQQRIAIARAMLKPCEIILADEPTGNLDEGNKQAVIDLFRKLKDMGKTVVCVTHDEEMARQSDRVVHIGKLGV